MRITCALAIAVLGACRNTVPASRLCDSMAISAQISQRLREDATRRFLWADHDLVQAERWREEIASVPETDEHKNSARDNRDDALLKAQQDERGAETLAVSAYIVHATLADVADLVATSKFQSIKTRLLDFKYELSSMLNASDPKKRQDLLAEWTQHAKEASDVETSLVGACYAEAGGGPRPGVILPMINIKIE